MINEKSLLENELSQSPQLSPLQTDILCSMSNGSLNVTKKGQEVFLNQLQKQQSQKLNRRIKWNTTKK